MDLAALADMIEGGPEWFVNEFDDADLIGALRLAHAMRWRPIDEAPIPDHEHVPIYWLFPCLIQDEAGVVYAGFARYASTNSRGSNRVLRWYEGVSQRYAQILHPRYFMSLPQPRKD